MKIGMQIVKALSSQVAKYGTRMLGCTACLALVATTLYSPVHAQFFNGGLLNRVVGGVSIDAQGMVRDATLADQEEVLRKMREQFRGASPDFAKVSSLRMVSLKGLQAKIAESVKSGEPLSEEVQLLGGLTRIEYVFVYPDRSDIVLAGPAESWTISKSGAIVGQTTGRPMMYLDDLLAAFRTVQMARREGISISIDPTEQGSQRLGALLKNVVVGPNTDIAQLEASMREAFGPQTVSLTGAPRDSHMARILLAADYQMKRYGMNIVEAPVKGLPSYIDLIKNRSSKLPQNRWWMACDYNAIEHTEDMLAWKLSGRGIKTLTEEEMVGQNGKRKQSGKVDVAAQKWAELFTDKLEELSVKDPVFGELRNIMDLCVVAALIESKGLIQQSGCDMSLLRDSKDSIELAKFGSPENLPAQCSFLKTSNGLMTTASGGVIVDSWSVVDSTKLNNAIQEVRQQAGTENSSWCWN